ncbi:MAG: CNNM domain-containing protein [bacterium]
MILFSENILPVLAISTGDSEGAIISLIIFVLVALGFSFLCSIWEAVLLSTSFSHIELLVKQGKRAGRIMRHHKENLEQGISAILTLNTIAHTVGAAGAGAQAAIIFGNKWIGLISAILTFLILIFSEIIPKTLGAFYWKQLTPFTAYGVKALIWILYPVVWGTQGLSRLFTPRKREAIISRSELEVLAQIGVKEGTLKEKEHLIFKNLLYLNRVKVSDIMTPRTVVFMLQEDMTVGEVLANHRVLAYSRIPVYKESMDDVAGLVLRYHILSAAVEGKEQLSLHQLARPIHAVPETVNVARLLEEFIRRQEHIFLVINEYGGTEGIITLEDAIESLLGAEITDETDLVADLQVLAKQRHSRRLQPLGLSKNEKSGEAQTTSTVTSS